jgi:hypothetical protein
MLVDLGIDAGWLWRLVWKKSIPEAARTEGVAEILHEDLFVVGVATDNQKKIEKMDRNVEKLSEGRVRFYYSPELAALAA